MNDTYENRLKAIANVLSAISFYKGCDHPDENTYVWWDEEAFEDEYDFTRYKVPHMTLFEWLANGTEQGQITCYHIQDDQIKEIDDSWWHINDLLKRLIDGFFNIQQA